MASQNHGNSPQEAHYKTCWLPSTFFQTTSADVTLRYIDLSTYRRAADLDHDQQDEGTAVAETTTIHTTSTMTPPSISCSEMIKASDNMENKPSLARGVTTLVRSLLGLITETPKEGRSEAAALDKATLDKEATIISRIAYNTGYGDFSFGRMIDRRRSFNLDEGEYSMQGMSQGSHGNIIEEIDGFKGYGNSYEPLDIADSIVTSQSLLTILTDSARFRSSTCPMMSVAISSSS